MNRSQEALPIDEGEHEAGLATLFDEADPALMPWEADPDPFEAPLSILPWLERPESFAILDDTRRRAEERLGAAALRTFMHEAMAVVEWAEEHHDEDGLRTYDDFARIVIARKWRDFLRRHTGLYREWKDDADRRRALDDPKFLLVYADRWRQRMRAWGWRLPRLTLEESIEEIVGLLIEAVLSHAIHDYECPGEDAGYNFVRVTRQALRRRRRFRRVGVEALAAHPDPQPSAEAMLIAEEERRLARSGVAALRAESSRPQRRWLDATLTLAENGGKRGDVSAARVAESLGKHRANGRRAFAKLEKVARRVCADLDVVQNARR